MNKLKTIGLANVPFYIFLGLFIILILSVNANAQNKQDYVWIFSNDTEATEGNEAYGFDFTKDQHLKSLQGLVPIEIAGLNASICDKEGNLLMYSNGCKVIDKNHNIMPNGRNLNNGDYFEMIGDSCFNGYLGKQDIIILPDPGDENGYYVLHKPIIYFPNQDIDHRELRFSYVDLNLNDGNGQVTEKNVVISDESELFYNYLTAIKHFNQRDWWIINPIYGSNEYLIFLLDQNGFSIPQKQSIGPGFHWNASGSGTAVFSPDGNSYAYFNKDDNLLLYDFDRSNGNLSNLKQLTLKTNGPIVGNLSTVEFSPNSRFLYIGVRDSLWQVDTQEEQLEDGVELIDVWDGTQDPFATTFTLMALAPNCKIYMASGSSTNTYHVINSPNEKGKDCDFVQHGIKLPYTSSLGNMPNFPRFRVDDDEKCDPNIGSVFGETVFYRRDLSVFPNPVTDNLTIEIPDNKLGKLFVFDMKGQLVWQSESRLQDIKKVDLSFLEAGQYSVEFVPDNNTDHLIWTKQIVKF